MLSQLQLHVKTELGMHAIAGNTCLLFWFLLMRCLLCPAKSPLGWKIVSFMEQDPDLDKSEHGMDISELRAKEKAMMQHERTFLWRVSFPVSFVGKILFLLRRLVRVL